MVPIAQPVGIISLGADTELRPVLLSDAAELYAAIDRNRARLRQWLPWVTHEYSEADTEQFLKDRIRENADRVAVTMTIRRCGEICGAIGLHRFDLRHRSSSIGYWIDGASEGQGIVTRACRAIVDEGFAGYNLHRIEIRCATGNTKSCAVPGRLGFTEEGTLRQAEWLYDRFVDLRVFSQLQPEWEKFRGTSTGFS